MINKVRLQKKWTKDMILSLPKDAMSGASQLFFLIPNPHDSSSLIILYPTDRKPEGRVFSSNFTRGFENNRDIPIDSIDLSTIISLEYKEIKDIHHLGVTVDIKKLPRGSLGHITQLRIFDDK